MLRVAFVVAVAAAAYIAVPDTTRAAPGAPLPEVTGTDITPAYYYHHRYYRYRWHGHYYHHRHWRYHRWYYY
jgi:hypothetical protein